MLQIHTQPMAAFTPQEGFIEGAVKDPQLVAADWTPVDEVIQGVQVREVRNILRGRGTLTEIYRTDWALDDAPVDQVFQLVLAAAEVSAWHVHRETTDRLFITHGHVRIVLHDGRQGSPTFGRLNEFRFGAPRPAIVSVPPGVWHGVQNLGDVPATVLNLVDRAYRYDDPDHWRLPADSDRIPFRFDGLR
jgi:dTDP-4-dehydrorhamnose 3,5-epimerase